MRWSRVKFYPHNESSKDWPQHYSLTNVWFIAAGHTGYNRGHRKVLLSGWYLVDRDVL